MIRMEQSNFKMIVEMMYEMDKVTQYKKLINRIKNNMLDWTQREPFYNPLYYPMNEYHNIIIVSNNKPRSMYHLIFELSLPNGTKKEHTIFYENTYMLRTLINSFCRSLL